MNEFHEETPQNPKNKTIIFCLNQIKPILGFCLLLLLLIYEIIVMSVMHITCKLLLNLIFINEVTQSSCPYYFYFN